MKYNNYWTKRQEERLKLVEKITNDNILSLKKNLENVARNLEREIRDIYIKYADDNNLSYQKAIQEVSKTELKNLKADLEYYIENAKNNATSKRKELQRLSSKARISRLDAYKAKIIMYADSIENLLLSETINALNEIYKESYLYTMYSMDNINQVGPIAKFNMPNDKIIKSLLTYPWSGKNYSEKLWGRTDEFIRDLGNVVTVGLIQGKNVNSIALELRRKVLGKGNKGGQLYKYKRLIRTEAAYITEQATYDSYKDLGVEKYEYLATLDLRTSKICQSLDNKVYDLKDAKIGVNYPPMHCFCRSTTIPVIIWEDEENTETRIARNISYRNITVKKQSYKEWKNNLEKQKEK